VDKERIEYLEEHLNRLEKGCLEILEKNPDRFNWKEIITILININGLLRNTWVVKLMISEGKKGLFSESNTGNILIIKDKTVIIPESKHRLPGIMEQNVILNYKNKGFKITERKVNPEELFNIKTILVTNSLMGAVEGQLAVSSLQLAVCTKTTLHCSLSMVFTKTMDIFQFSSYFLGREFLLRITQSN
jgi:branched-subunit amino acid aminotransferase/4-amino-4-deoxychorismate lyase